MDELLPRLSGPEQQQREFGAPFPSMGLDADGFPVRWDSLCCDHIFQSKQCCPEGVDALHSGPGLAACQLDFKVRTATPPLGKTAQTGAGVAFTAPPLQLQASQQSADSHGATDSQAAGMSLRSGQVVKSHASDSHAEADATDSEGEQQQQNSAMPPQKRPRRRRKTDQDDYVYSQHSDPEEKKLEKRRAKNRRTARASRERKQAELAQLKSDLAARTQEVARLQHVIAAKDAQIAQMAGAGSPARAPRLGVGEQSTTRRASESAVLRACIYVVKFVLTKRTAPPKTASPPCLTICAEASTGDSVPQLKRELKGLFEQLPADEQPPVYRKLQEALSRLGRGSAAHERLDSWLAAEVSDESEHL